jgi:hypothetical protein
VCEIEPGTRSAQNTLHPATNLPRSDCFYEKL